MFPVRPNPPRKLPVVGQLVALSYDFLDQLSHRVDCWTSRGFYPKKFAAESSSRSPVIAAWSAFPSGTAGNSAASTSSSPLPHSLAERAKPLESRKQNPRVNPRSTDGSCAGRSEPDGWVGP